MTKTSAEIRQAFLSFFERNNHTVLPSGPLVPANDPTLMFANAGMVQFKDLFTGRETRAYKRATTSQKCIRISGKHNDLEAVGPSPRHQTFFEMLGNFSFGDYFKEEAIHFAWEFITKDLDLPKDRLMVTYFKGEEGIPADEVARDLWKKITGFGDDRIRGLGMADNFWQMGDTGPCGPCSEIYFCNGPDVDVQRFGEEQTPEGYGWLEFWNLVFMQFEKSIVNGESRMNPLPAPSIDTGAGLERLSTAVQGKLSNYDLELLRELVETAATLSKKKYTGSMSNDDVSMRVIADHARTTAFLIAEGITPDRAGRSYVLRRVMRRAIRHGHRLGITEPFLHQVASKVVDLMGDHYGELRERRDLILSLAEAEEVRFRNTIERGLSLLEERFLELNKTGQRELPGADAFQLYDTYGFPLDLTDVICQERGFVVEQAGYDAALEEARRKSEFKEVEHAVEEVYREARSKLPGEATVFTGYERESDLSKICAIVRRGTLSESASAGDAVELIVERTPFYAESGGQLGDQGRILVGEAVVLVEDTVRPFPGCVVHRGRVETGTVQVGDEARLEVDHERREQTRRHHSVTHLLHWALRKTLGSHAQQKGSQVGAERLRFDFTHQKALSTGELTAIEDLVNAEVLRNTPIVTEVMTLEAAKKHGAMMIFEEKYGDTVRMLHIGPSLELCGGTHARATGDIGLFKITSEGGVAAGVRRITATAGKSTLAHLRGIERSLAEVADLAKATPTNLVEKMEKFIGQHRALEKQIEDLQRKLATGGGGGSLEAMLEKAKQVGDIRVLGLLSEVTDRGALRELAEQLRDKLGDSIVLVGSKSDDKAQLVLTVAKSLTGRYKAGDLIRPIAEMVGGSGGGRPDMAQAGGTDASKLEAAVAKFYEGF
ncbi:MAG: alanine--tRNA ligase [Polyangiaceae bacterium]|nr:alanine--tRNA ligase [Polyangiaceae bacterium]